MLFREDWIPDVFFFLTQPFSFMDRTLWGSDPSSLTLVFMLKQTKKGVRIGANIFGKRFRCNLPTCKVLVSTNPALVLLGIFPTENMLYLDLLLWYSGKNFSTLF